jgi:hypothetical protein
MVGISERDMNMQEYLNETRFLYTTHDDIVGMLETIDSKSFETDDLKVSKQDVSRTVIDNKVAKVVIPKKYLDQIMKTTEFSKVLVKEVQNG